MDIGGTFTDVVAYDEETGTYSSGKVSTTPEDLASGVLAGLEAVVESLDAISFTVHGTTIGLNAFLQRRGERVLLLATDGASDVYHIARGSRPKLYDLHFRKPLPLVPRSDIVPVGERLSFAGEERVPLDEEAVQAAAVRAREDGIRAVAIAFLFSYVNPEHELRAEQIVRDVHPEASVSLSHRVAREWREYERTSSTVLDAYIAPVVDSYIERLEGAMRERGLAVPLHVMQSSGGILTAQSARERPIQTLLSGPAGGTMGGAALSDLLGRPNLLCIDMGGTSFDVSLVVDGEPDISRETTLEGLPLLMPIVRLHTIGAGGGSIGYAEAGGLRVGPESAGAVPGPACYGRGGTRPTVTDANLLLGRIDPAFFLGGRMRLDQAAAEAAVSSLAREFGLEALAFAEGMVEVINAKMAQAIRTITVEHGIEPRDFTIVAFGGAGPMHAAFLARELEIAEVVVPPSPGAFSAWGMLQTRLRHDFSHAFYRPAADAVLDELRELLSMLGQEGERALAREGIDASRIDVEWLADMRYVGQEYTVGVPIESAELREQDFLEVVSERFNNAHETRYGHANRGAPCEFVALRASALGDLGRAAPERRPAANGSNARIATRRTVTFGRASAEAGVVYREELLAGMVVEGPAIVEEETATTVVPPGATLRMDELGSLTLAVGEG